MALRSATAPDVSYAVESMQPGDTIIVTDPDTIVDNQDWCVMRRTMLISDCFDWTGTSTASPAWATMAQARPCSGLRANYSGAGGAETPWKCGIYCWATDGATSFDVGLNVGANYDFVNQATPGTSPVWVTVPCVNCTFDLRTAVAATLSIVARITAGGGNCNVAGYAIMF